MRGQKSHVPWYESNRIMGNAGFILKQIREAQIWAAKHQECIKCGAPPYVPCKNLVGIKNLGFELARENKFPHKERIDFQKLEQALRDKGYK